MRVTRQGQAALTGVNVQNTLKYIQTSKNSYDQCQSDKKS